MIETIVETLSTVGMFIAIWCVVLFLLSLIGVWSALAGNYRLHEPFNGKWHLCSGYFGWVGYGNCLKLGADPKGLYIGMLWPFRLAHPPMRIPWRDVTAQEKGFRWFKTVTFRFTQHPSVPLRISARVARKLTNDSGGQLSIAVGA